ncbi:MAG: MBL fold metallo-hydrolase, partial [Pseudomonadota bacterium]
MQNEKQTISRRDLIIGGAALAAPALVATTAMAEFNTTSSGLTIGTYVSDPNNVDAVNTHWIEAPEGLIVIDVQRLLPEAERARDIMAATGKPIRAVFVTHAHTDHYAGLSVIRAAAPDAEVFAIEPTIRTMRDDTFGFNASRLQRHGNLFPSQEIITEALPERIVSHGERLSLAGLDLEILALTPGESDGTAAIHLPEHRTIFPGDFVQNTKIPVPFESH